MNAAHQIRSFEYLKAGRFCALSMSEAQRCSSQCTGEINGPAEAAAPQSVIKKIKLREPECS